VAVRLQRPQCPAGLGSCGNAVLVVHLSVCLLQRGCVLLRVPSSAVVILAREHGGPPDKVDSENSTAAIRRRRL
jgi:hypothetical protein